jgi:hypothetical protein
MVSGIKRQGLRKARHFVAYGGPENGLIVHLRDGASENVTGNMRHADSLPFSNLLTATSDGGSGLVPMEDHDLKQTFFAAHERGDYRSCKKRRERKVCGSLFYAI